MLVYWIVAVSGCFFPGRPVLKTSWQGAHRTRAEIPEAISNYSDNLTSSGSARSEVHGILFMQPSAGPLEMKVYPLFFLDWPILSVDLKARMPPHVS
jgi:hypothetical protein